MINFYKILKHDYEDLAEMTDARRGKEMDKARKRITDFWDRSKGDNAKFSAQINLRTKKMTKIEKLKIWFDALEDENFHDEAEVAYQKIKRMSESTDLDEKRSARALFTGSVEGAISSLIVAANKLSQDFDKRNEKTVVSGIKNVGKLAAAISAAAKKSWEGYKESTDLDERADERDYNTNAVREIRQDLTKSASRLSSLASKDKRFKKAEDLVDKARKILFDLQD